MNILGSRSGLVILLMAAALLSCKQQRQAKKIEDMAGEFIPVVTDSIHKGDSLMNAEIAPYRKQMDIAMDSIVVVSSREFYRAKPNGILNNLVADMVLKEVNDTKIYHADFCLLNYGGLRRPLPAGPLKKSNIFQLMPFQNEAVLVKLRPLGMKHLLTYLYKTNGQPISGLEVHYKDSIPTQVYIDKQVWDSTKAYWVVTSDYTANGGDRMNFFAERDSIIYSGDLLRNLIFEYLDSLQKNNLMLVGDTTQRIFIDNSLENK